MCVDLAGTARRLWHQSCVTPCFTLEYSETFLNFIDGAIMTALPNTRDALGESWTTTSRRARRIARHSRHAAEDIATELRSLMSELEDTLSDGTQADAAALRAQLSKRLEVARSRLNDTRDAVRQRAEVAL